MPADRVYGANHVGQAIAKQAPKAWCTISENFDVASYEHRNRIERDFSTSAASPSDTAARIPLPSLASNLAAIR